MDLSAISIDVFSLALGLLSGFLLVALIGLWPVLKLIRERATLAARLGSEQESRDRAQAEFRLLAQAALKDNQEQFLMLAAEKLQAAQKDGAHDLEKRQTAISELLKPLQKNLETLGSTVEQIKGTDQILKDEVRSLTRETARLSGALRDPAAQGQWGEYILEGVMEHSGLIKGVHYVTQESITTAHRPDVIINLNGGLRIVVDAKAPLNDFAKAIGESLSENDQAQIMKNLSAQVRAHVMALSKKGYWQNLEEEGVDFTVLFLPSESLFSMALRADPGLVDLAASKNIILASPVLMMALLRVVKIGWRQADLAENARAISEQGSILYQRLSVFIDHLGRVGKGLSGAVDGYNSAVGSLDRMVLPATRRLQELGVQDGGKKLPEPAEIETTPRRIAGND